jgi:hypothetical protein
MSQSNCLQVNLYSSQQIQYENIDILKNFMETNYSYICKRVDLKTANKNQVSPGKTSVLIVQNYVPNNMNESIVSELNNSIFATSSSKPTQLNDMLNHELPTLTTVVNTLEGVIDCSTNQTYGHERFDVLRDSISGTTYSNANMSIYLGDDNFPVEMKWFNKSLDKSEGRKSSFKLNKGDLFIIVSDFTQDSDYTIEIKTGSYVKTREKKQAKSIKKVSQSSTENIVAVVSHDEPKQKKKASKSNIHRRITRKRPNGKLEKVWRKSNYNLKEGESWLDSWKVNKTVYDTLKEAEMTAGESNIVTSTATSSSSTTAKKKTDKKSVAKNKKKAVVVQITEPIETTTIESSNQPQLSADTDKLTDDLDDTMIDILDDIPLDTPNESDTDSINAYASVLNEDKPSDSPVSSNDSECETDDDAEEIQTDEIDSSLNDELKPDNYDDDDDDNIKNDDTSIRNDTVDATLTKTVPSNSLSGKFKTEHVVNIQMLLITIPKDVVLCDENGTRTKSRKIFALSHKDNDVDIGNTHRIGNRVYGFETEYPTYNLISM